MQIIGFTFTKISASKSNLLKKAAINTTIDFVNVEKQKTDLIKDKETLKMEFKFDITYKNSENKDKETIDAQVQFEGSITAVTNEEEGKEILKLWKKKDFSNQLGAVLSNLIIKKCSARALILQDELNIPSHIPIPQISIGK